MPKVLPYFLRHWSTKTRIIRPHHKPRIYYLCPDIDRPCGGTKQLYRHVDILNKRGYSAFILHGQQGFRLTWFQNNTPVAHKSFSQITKSSAIVAALTNGVFGPLLNPFYLAKSTLKLLLNVDHYRSDRLQAVRRSWAPLLARQTRNETNITETDYLVVPEFLGPTIM